MILGGIKNLRCEVEECLYNTNGECMLDECILFDCLKIEDELRDDVYETD